MHVHSIMAHGRQQAALERTGAVSRTSDLPSTPQDDLVPEHDDEVRRKPPIYRVKVLLEAQGKGAPGFD